MASTLPSMLSYTELPPHCSPTTSFLHKVSVYFGICVPTPLGFASTLLGSLSILSWLFAQLPQIYKNFQLKSTAGLSIFFLAEWLLGDLTNLLGALFTNQAGWQVILASYYVFVDVCLVIQYFWYTYIIHLWQEGSVHSGGSSDVDDDANSELINSLSPINSNFMDGPQDHAKNAEDEPHRPSAAQPLDTPRFSNVNYEKDAGQSSSFPGKTNSVNTYWSGPSPRTLIHAATVSLMVAQATAAPVSSPVSSFAGQSGHHIQHITKQTPLEIAGTIISWCSTAFYLISRLPQLYKNWRRQSTAGLSPLLFLAAFSGNLFYSSSMLTNPNAWYNFGPYGGHGWAGQDGSRRSDWIASAAPFFLGAFGVLFLDATMGVQFLLYGDEQEKLVKIRDRYGFGRWERVNGWMRGWIPSLKKEKVVDLAESQRLLSQSRELNRHSYQSQYGGM